MKRSTRAAGLAAVLALSLTTAAQAHPGVYSVDAKIAKTFARQTITVTATGGTFKPSAGATAVPYNASAADVEAALQADPAIGYDNIDVIGGSGSPYTLTWNGALAGTATAPVAPDTSALTGGTATVAVASPGGANVTFLTDPIGATMATQRQYVAVSDGYALGYKETNGVAGGGLLNLKVLPGGYRGTPASSPQLMTPEQKITYSASQTGLQLHATCTGVAALENPTNIYSWQTRPDGDPFYAYIPWQKTAAGLGDDPAKWIPVVKSLTAGLGTAPADGIDLSTLTTVADLTNACASIGGTYHAADAQSTVATAMVADAVTAATTPLNAQIAQLTSDKTAAEAAKTALSDQLAAAKADAATARAEATAAQTELARIKSGTGKLTLAKDGPAGAPVLVRMVLSQSEASRLHLKARLLGSVTQLIGTDGTTTVNLAVSSRLRAAARKAGVKRITIDAISGDRYTRIPAGA